MCMLADLLSLKLPHLLIECELSHAREPMLAHAAPAREQTSRPRAETIRHGPDKNMETTSLITIVSVPSQWLRCFPSQCCDSDQGDGGEATELRSAETEELEGQEEAYVFARAWTA